MMALIVAGRFTTFEQANGAAQALYTEKLDADNVNIFFVTPPGQHAKYPIGGDHYADPAAQPGGMGAIWGGLIGAVIGGLLGCCVWLIDGRYWLIPVVCLFLGAYLGSFAGALKRMRGRRRRTRPGQRRGLREAGVMLAAHVTSTTASVVASVLREHGAEDIEQIEGTWEDGQWQDFDPRVPPAREPLPPSR